MAERRDGKPEDESVLARWSRRKQAARAERSQPSEAPLPAAGDQVQEVAEAPAVEQPDLPDPETLDAGSDFKPFLKPGVPADLKRAALRRLWRLDPFYSRHDGLSDYCEDFSDQATASKGIRTAYRVGRGLLDRVDEAREPQPASRDTAPGEPLSDPEETTAEEASGGARVQPAAKTGPRRPRPSPKRV